MGKQRRIDKKSKTLGAERCADIVTLYINTLLLSLFPRREVETVKAS
jgi:hypothetical protein